MDLESDIAFFIHSLTVLDIPLLSIMFHEGIGALELNRLYQAAVRSQDGVPQLLLTVETVIMWQSAAEV